MTPPTDRTRRPFVLAEAMTILSRTPATLDALLRGLPDGWIAAHEGGATWSPFDVLGHLVHCEHANWMPRVRLILESGESHPFDAFDRLAQFSALGGRTLPDLLDEFASARQHNVHDLTTFALTSTDLDRRGQHPAFGVVTLRQLLATWVAHDLDHVVQISRVLARQYSNEVGPWRQFLRIINGEPI